MALRGPPPPRLSSQSREQRCVPNARTTDGRNEGTHTCPLFLLSWQGLRGLYAGLAPALVGSTVAWSLYFLFYSAAKERYQKLLGKEELGAVQHLAAAAESGALVQARDSGLTVAARWRCAPVTHTGPVALLPGGAPHQSCVAPENAASAANIRQHGRRKQQGQEDVSGVCR